MPPILIYRNDVSEREIHGQTVIIVQEGGRLVQTLYLLIDVTPLRHNPSSPKLPVLPGHPRQGLFASGGLPVPHILTYRKDDSEREIHGYTLILRGGTRELLPVLVLVALCLFLAYSLRGEVKPYGAMSCGGLWRLSWATFAFFYLGRAASASPCSVRTFQ